MSLGKPSKVQLADKRVLTGTRYDVSNLESIQILFDLDDQTASLRGLYRLTFDNGEAYVGQATNVARRYSDHRRRWGDDIRQLEFFPIPNGDLNEPERQLIRLTEANGPVRNLKDTNRPGGLKSLDVKISDGLSVSLPWERAKRIKPGDAAVSPTRQKFFALTGHSDYLFIRDVAGWYIYNTIPDPFNTQKHLWVTTCLPSTNKSNAQRRLAVLNTGALETLVISETRLDDAPDEWLTEVFINAAPSDRDPVRLDSPDLYWQVHRAKYPYGETFRWCFTLLGLVGVLNGEIEFPHMNLLLDSAYELNVRLMRQNGGGMFRKYHNGLLSADFLSGVLEWRE